MKDLLIYIENLEIIDEITPIFCISLLGSCIHEYIFKSNKKFFLNLTIWINTLMASIICFAIDPFIMNISPRLVLLPPLLIGLSGMDLIKHLSTLEGLLTIIEYILSFFGINRKEKSSISDSDNETTSYEDLNTLLSTFFYLVTSLLSTYYTNNDKKEFLKTYHAIKKDYDLLNNELLKHKTIPITSTLLFGSITKKVIELDNIYNSICSSKSLRHLNKEIS